MIGIAAPDKNTRAWLQALQQHDDSVEISVWPDLSTDTELLLCWNPPPDAFDDLPNLKAICAMGAGLDNILSHPKLPKHIPLSRLTNDQLSIDMYHYVAHCIDSWRLNFPDYQQDKVMQKWQPQQYRKRKDISITVLGLGHIGAYVAEKLANDDYQVRGWSRSQKVIAGVESFSHFETMLSAVEQADVLVCLLALTSETKLILDKQLFARMAQNSCLINVARGAHLQEQDLLNALNNPIKNAFLDVFAVEPIPTQHPFWHHPSITITPHIASLTDPQSAAMEVIDLYRTLHS